ncbi:hypothetical protein [Dickeya fangzhongdai]
MSAFAGAQVVSMGWGLTTMFTILAIPALLTSLMILAKGQFGYSRPVVAELSY